MNMSKDTRRSPLQIVIDAEDALTQAHLAGKYITKLREEIQELVNACDDETIEVLTGRRMLTKQNIELRAEAKRANKSETKETKDDDIFS
jgi:hypothetical protein